MFAAVALLAFAGSYIALCVFRPAATAVSLLDIAGTLKQHKGEIPLVGGLSILAGYLLTLAIHPVFFTTNTPFLIASVLLVTTGALDDRFALSPVLRLIVQVAVSLTAVFGAGLIIDNIGISFLSGMFEVAWLAVPFAVLVIVGAINAWNMIDGIDGLASMQAFIALGFLLIVSGSSAPALQASLLALMCGIGAFFLFNLPFRRLQRQRTFLGDAGSMFLGLAIVWHALALSQGESAVISPITALWFVAMPVYDVISTTVRRVLRGVSPLAGDRQHLHHLLQDHGLSIRQTLFVLSLLASFFGAIGALSHFAGVSDGWMFSLFALFGVAYFFGVRHLVRATCSDRAPAL